MILAQLESVAPATVRDFALIIGGIAATAYYIKALFWGDGKIPQPLRTMREEKFITEKDCLARHSEETSRIQQLHQQLVNMESAREQQRELTAESHTRIEADRMKANEMLHEKINGVDRRVAGLEREAELTNQRLVGIDSKLDRLIERRL